MLLHVACTWLTWTAIVGSVDAQILGNLAPPVAQLGSNENAGPIAASLAILVLGVLLLVHRVVYLTTRTLSRHVSLRMKLSVRRFLGWSVVCFLVLVLLVPAVLIRTGVTVHPILAGFLAAMPQIPAAPLAFCFLGVPIKQQNMQSPFLWHIVGRGPGWYAASTIPVLVVAVHNALYVGGYSNVAVAIVAYLVLSVGPKLITSIPQRFQSKAYRRCNCSRLVMLAAAADGSSDCLILELGASLQKVWQAPALLQDYCNGLQAEPGKAVWGFTWMLVVKQLQVVGDAPSQLLQHLEDVKPSGNFPSQKLVQWGVEQEQLCVVLHDEVQGHLELQYPCGAIQAVSKLLLDQVEMRHLRANFWLLPTEETLHAMSGLIQLALNGHLLDQQPWLLVHAFIRLVAEPIHIDGEFVALGVDQWPSAQKLLVGQAGGLWQALHGLYDSMANFPAPSNGRLPSLPHALAYVIGTMHRQGFWTDGMMEQVCNFMIKHMREYVWHRDIGRGTSNLRHDANVRGLLFDMSSFALPIYTCGRQDIHMRIILDQNNHPHVSYLQNEYLEYALEDVVFFAGEQTANMQMPVPTSGVAVGVLTLEAVGCGVDSKPDLAITLPELMAQVSDANRRQSGMFVPPGSRWAQDWSRASMLNDAYNDMAVVECGLALAASVSFSLAANALPLLLQS